jgi:hypothetical protein
MLFLFVLMLVFQIATFLFLFQSFQSVIFDFFFVALLIKSLFIEFQVVNLQLFLFNLIVLFLVRFIIINSYKTYYIQIFIITIL